MEIETIHILLWLVPIGFISRDYSTLRYELTCGRWGWRSRPLFAFIVFLPIFIMTVYGRVRADTWAYLSMFRALRTDAAGALEAIQKAKDPGFTVFGLIVKTIFGSDQTAYRFLIAAVHTIPLILVLRKYSLDYVFSIFLFIAFGYHLSWMMNGLRQFMAVTIIFAATPWILKQDAAKTIPIILFAALFHKSALIFIPVFFIVQGEVWNWKTLLFSFLMVIATLFFARNGDSFDTLADNVGYSISSMKESGDDGTNPIRVLVHSIPMILSFIYRDGLKKDNNPLINLCVNMSVLTAGMYLVSMVTSGIMVGRMPIYTSLYNLILLPYLVYHCFPRNIMKFVFLGVIVFHFAFLYIEAGGLW